MDKKEFGKYIARTRKGKNLTQQKLADLLNVSVSAVSKWEQGRCFPDLELFHKIADALGVSFSELISCLQPAETDTSPQMPNSDDRIPSKVDLPTTGPESDNTMPDSSPEISSLSEQPADLFHEAYSHRQPPSAPVDPESITAQQKTTIKKGKRLKPALLCSLVVVLLAACFSFVVYASMQKVRFTTLHTEIVYEKMYDPTETEVFTIYIQVHGKYSYGDIEEHTHEAWENGTAEFETDANTICLRYYDTANYEDTEEEYRSYLLKGI